MTAHPITAVASVARHHQLLRPFLPAIGLGLQALSHDYVTMRALLERTPPTLGAATSATRALQTARRAARRVPAYRAFLRDRALDPDRIGSLAELPETDKATYIDRYSLVARCLDGRLPLRGTTIDESSGSTGTRYNWVRSAAERRHVRRMISFFARYTFGGRPLVVLNAFSMGAWATGLTTAIALEGNGLVKATGPHVDKIVGVMRELGTGPRYLLVGYPPFIKLLLDEAEASGLAWADYDVHALLGGESNSELLRDYLLWRLRSVYSGYGATDVEIGLAAETPVCLALRRLAAERAEIAEALFGESGRSPMVFQYNPFLITWRRTSVASCSSPSPAPRRCRPRCATTSTTRGACCATTSCGHAWRGSASGSRRSCPISAAWCACRISTCSGARTRRCR